MKTVAGRPIFAGLYMLLHTQRMFELGEEQRLPHILSESRKYKNDVSTQLADQVMLALFELLRGFQAADAIRRVEPLHKALAESPNSVYDGLLTVLLRLVFILYAEDRSLMSDDSTYTRHYFVTGLFEKRLDEKAANDDEARKTRATICHRGVWCFRTVAMNPLPLVAGRWCRASETTWSGLLWPKATGMQRPYVAGTC